MAATKLNVGGGVGGVGKAEVSLVGESLILGEQEVVSFLLSNINSPVFFEEKDLVAGDNTINIPGGATNRVAGVLIVPDQEADFQAILKTKTTAADDEGFKLSKRSPQMLCFETPAKPDGTNALFVLKWAGYGRLDVAVTADAGTDKIIYAAHGLANGTRVKFRALAGGSLPGGLTEGVLYYVITAGAGDFEVSTSLGGTKIDLTTTGASFVISTADKFKLFWF